MKKLLAIMLLSVLMFNMMGHYVLYQYFVYKSDKIMNEHIANNQYNVNDLIEVKIPVKLPYVISWSAYENVSGQIQFKNNCYNYVKLKLTADTMYIKCIPNYEKTRLVSGNVISMKEVADVPLNKHDNLLVKKGGEDIYNLVNFSFNPYNIITGVHKFYGFEVTHIKVGNSETPFLPPEPVC